jgi:hypothetical protein
MMRLQKLCDQLDNGCNQIDRGHSELNENFSHSFQKKKPAWRGQ